MGAKILLVTGSSETMAKLEMSLDTRGHQVLPVEKGSDAIVELENDSTIDLILCDLILAMADSFDLLKRVRADHLRMDIPFIFIVQEEELLTDSLRKAAAIYGGDKFIFMDEFDAHRIRCEVEALLPEQLSSLPRVDSDQSPGLNP